MNQDIEINAGEDFEMSVDIYEDDGVTEKTSAGRRLTGRCATCHLLDQKHGVKKLVRGQKT